MTLDAREQMIDVSIHDSRLRCEKLLCFLLQAT